MKKILFGILFFIVLYETSVNLYVVRKCPSRHSCPKDSYGQILRCEDDEDCDNERICCKTTCGKGCVSK